MTEADSFGLWAAELNVQPLHPGEVVIYEGSIQKAHGLWVVHSQTGDDRYVLVDLVNEWERLNASRTDVRPVVG
jgi:hypothetical protein